MADDDEVDPFDAMMGIDAEEFAELLEECLDGSLRLSIALCMKRNFAPT